MHRYIKCKQTKSLQHNKKAKWWWREGSLRTKGFVRWKICQLLSQIFYQINTRRYLWW